MKTVERNWRQLPFRELLQAARTGDNSARTYLYVNYGPHFRRVITKKLRRYRVGWAASEDDVFDSVVCRVWQEEALNTLCTEVELLKYVSRAIEREILDLRRNLTARCRDYRRSEPLPDEPSLVARDCDPAYRASLREQLESIRAQLSQQNRQVLDLWLAGNGWVRIGSVLGIGSERLRKRFYRCLAELRCRLAEASP